MLQIIKSNYASVLSVKDSFIMHHAFIEELGELEEGMRRAFYGPFGRDIKIKLEKGVLLPSSFDGMNSDEMTLKQIIEGPPEYRGRKNRNKEIHIS